MNDEQRDEPGWGFMLVMALIAGVVLCAGLLTSCGNRGYQPPGEDIWKGVPYVVPSRDEPTKG